MSATVLGRRDVFRLAAAFLAAAAASAPKLEGAAPSNNGARIIVSDANAVVETAYGKVRGYTEGGIHTFKGIPYSGTTAGSARFLPPQKPQPWTGVRDSLQYGPACPQESGRGPDLPQFFFEFDRGSMDEDCLRLNVWTPGVNDNRKRPVLFWLHGGDSAAGRASRCPLTTTATSLSAATWWSCRSTTG